MARRTRAPIDIAPEPSTANPAKFTSSGSALLDLILGGGWAQGKIANIVGDSSSGKTLLAIEACINFARQHGAECVRYAESEDALDGVHAQRLGLPDNIQRTEPNAMRTVENFAIDVQKFMKEGKAGKPLLYIIDSLDGLSDAAELEREVGDAAYGTGKAKLLSEFFRKHVGDLATHPCTLLVISQVRDAIGVTFGETKKRSGGRALQFYCSQVVWLAEKNKDKHVVRGVERITGVTIEANCKKNKVGIPFRRSELYIQFDYGVDDEISMLNWLKKAKALYLLDEEGYETNYEEVKKDIAAARALRDRRTLATIRDALEAATLKLWTAIEADIAPKLSKYGE